MDISESASRVMGCRNAKPPINHAIKHKQEAEIKEQVAEFLASGGKVLVMPSVGVGAKDLTYKERNDSTYVKGA